MQTPVSYCNHFRINRNSPHTHAHTRTHTHTTHTYRDARAHTHADIRAHLCAHTHTLTQARTHTHTPARPYSHTHTHKGKTAVQQKDFGVVQAAMGVIEGLLGMGGSPTCAILFAINQKQQK